MLSAVAHWLVASLLHPLLPCMLFCIFVLFLVRFVWFLYFAVLLYRLSFTIHHIHLCRILSERKNIRAACLLPHKYLNSCESGRILLGCIIPLCVCVCARSRAPATKAYAMEVLLRWHENEASRIATCQSHRRLDLTRRRVQSALGRYLGRSLEHIRPEWSGKRRIDMNGLRSTTTAQ